MKKSGEDSTRSSGDMMADRRTRTQTDRHAHHNTSRSLSARGNKFRNVSQVKVKKRLVYGSIASVWFVLPAYVATMGVVSTDILKGTCIPWGIYSSFVAQKTISSSIFVVALVVPLILMVFCYSRIVHALRTRVSTRHVYRFCLFYYSYVCTYVHHLGLYCILFRRVLIYKIDVALQLTKLRLKKLLRECHLCRVAGNTV